VKETQLLVKTFSHHKAVFFQQNRDYYYI